MALPMGSHELPRPCSWEAMDLAHGKAPVGGNPLPSCFQSPSPANQLGTSICCLVHRDPNGRVPFFHTQIKLFDRALPTPPPGNQSDDLWHPSISGGNGGWGGENSSPAPRCAFSLNRDRCTPLPHPKPCANLSSPSHAHITVNAV